MKKLYILFYYCPVLGANAYEQTVFANDCSGFGLVPSARTVRSACSSTRPGSERC